jgi:hypothetical protein
MNSYSTEAVVINLINDLSHKIELLPKDSIVRAKDLFEPELWRSSPKKIHLELGYLLADLVRQNMLPLVAAGKASNNHKQYIVI